MKNGRKIVGFDRKIELDWLDATAAQVAHGASSDEVRAYLWKMLEGSVSAGSSGSNSDRGKTITVLVHVWSEVPAYATSIRERALKLLREVDPEDRLGVHWALCLATYPFFWDVASTVGRSCVVEDRIVLSEVRRRLAERWGDRDITRRAAQRVIRSFVAWGVLADSERRGIYVPTVRKITAAPVVELLVEAVLVGSERAALPVRQLIGHPGLFPFAIEMSGAEFGSSSRFAIERQGVDLDLVRLAVARSPGA